MIQPCSGIFFPKDLGDAMAGRVRFLDESHSVIFTDKGIQFFSTRVETSPELVSQIPIEENIRSITYAQDKVGIVTDNVEGGDPYRLRIYDREGSLFLKRPLTTSIPDLILTVIWFFCIMTVPAGLQHDRYGEI